MRPFHSEGVTRPSSLVFLVLLLVCGGCDDDVAGPASAVRWRSHALDGLDTPAVIHSLRSAHGRTLAVGSSASGPFVLEYDGRAWTKTDLEGGAATRAFDLDFADDGRAVAVGGGLDGTARVWAERPEWTTVPLERNGLLRAVALGGAGEFVAVGGGVGAAPVARGSIDGDWVTSTVVLSEPGNEQALEEIVAVQAGWVVCGWDDGAEGTPESPYRVLLHLVGSTWTPMPTPCGGCTNREFTALARRGEAGLVLGGAITDWSTGAPDASIAALALYASTTQEWIEVVLPEAGALDRVNDVEVLPEGSMVLACGRDGTASIAILPASGGGGVEWSGDGASLFTVTRAHDGTLWVGGIDADGSPLLVRRTALF